MAGEVRYPAVALSGAGGAATAEVTIDPRSGTTSALVAGRPFASRPHAGHRRSLDASFLELRKTLRRVCKTCNTLC